MSDTTDLIQRLKVAALPGTNKNALDCEAADALEALYQGTMRQAMTIAEQAREIEALRAVLIESRQALEVANQLERGPIRDTIWMCDRPETLFDFLDVAIGAGAGKAVTP